MLAVLEPIWTIKPETATRVRQRMETVFDWSLAQGWRQGNPAGRSLLRVLPQVKRTKEHHRALPYSDVPAALHKIGLSTAYPATKLGFRFLVLTGARPGEVRGATWHEVDWDNSMWTVPAHLMMADRMHRMPLSTQAMAALRDACGLGTGEGLIFPAKRSGAALTDMAFNVLLRRLEIDAVPHGFRSNFRDWAAECSGAAWAVCESALAARPRNMGGWLFWV